MNIEEYAFSDPSISRVKVHDGVPLRLLLLKNNLTVISLNTEDSAAIFKVFADSCNICHGTKGGVKGNENIVGGQIVCDYCHSDKSYLNQDRESLVSAIKELIALDAKREIECGARLTSSEIMMCLQNLINPTNEGAKDE